MARIFVAGFESHGVEIFDIVSGAARLSTSGLDMDGNYCLECSGSADYASKAFLTSHGSLYFAFRLRYYSDPALSCGLIRFSDSGGTTTITVLRNTSYKTELRLGSYGGTVIATGSRTISAGTTYLVEIYYAPLNSGGTFTLKIDGVQEISYTGDTTAGLENILDFRLGSPSAGSVYGYSYYDDFIVDDANWIGKTYIQGLTITGSGTTTQWDPSTGSNYACVDEVPYSDTDYVYTNTNDEIDTYALSNLSGTIASIKAMALTARAAYDGSPTPTHIQLGVRSGGSDYFATDFSPPSSFGFLGQRILEVNPATSAAWTESGVNALEVGMKATA